MVLFILAPYSYREGTYITGHQCLRIVHFLKPQTLCSTEPLPNDIVFVILRLKTKDLVVTNLLFSPGS